VKEPPRDDPSHEQAVSMSRGLAPSRTPSNGNAERGSHPTTADMASHRSSKYLTWWKRLYRLLVARMMKSWLCYEAQVTFVDAPSPPFLKKVTIGQNSSLLLFLPLAAQSS